MGVTLKKKAKAKAKPTPKGSKLLAQVQKMVGQALKKTLQAQMESLPQVDVPITSTPIKGKVKSLGTIGSILKKHQEFKPGTPTSSDPGVVLKMWADDVEKAKAQRFSEMDAAAQAEFIGTLTAGSQTIYVNTVHNGVWIDMSEEAFQAFKVAAGKKLTEIAGMPTPVGVHLEKAKALTALEEAEADKLKKLVEKGKLVGFKAEDFAPFMAPLLPKMPSKKAEAELEEWLCHTVKTVLDYCQFEPFDKTTLFKMRDMVSKHYDSTLESGGVGPPVIFKMYGKSYVMHRVSNTLREALELIHGKLSPAEVQVFNQVFPPDGLLKPLIIEGSLPHLDPIVNMNEVVEWMQEIAKISFDFIHWQPLTKERLLKVRKYIEECYAEDLVPRFPVNFDADEKLPEEGVVHRTSVYLRLMLGEKEKDGLSDEAETLFAEVFPLPDVEKIAPLGGLGVKIGPKAPVFIKSQDELIAAFGEPSKSNVLDKYTAIMLQKTREYMKAHPEAVGVGPMDGGDIVQTLAPFSATPNQNGNFYPKGLWDKVVKKLEPKFSEAAAEDAKEQGLAEVEDLLSVHTEDPGLIPQAEVNVVMEDDVAYLATTIGGEVVGKKPITSPVLTATQKLTQKGLATLNRFGVVLAPASEPKSAPISPGVYTKEPDLKHLVPPMPAEHIELSFTTEKNKGT